MKTTKISLKYLFLENLYCMIIIIIINPLASLEEVASVFTSPYLSAGAPAQGDAKGLIHKKN